MTGYKSKRTAAQGKLESMTDLEIMRQALRVIKQLVIDESDDAPALQGARMRKLKIEKTLRERLAQPAQEPSYWLGYGLQAHTDKPFDGAKPLYTAPPQRPWVGLMDDEDWEHIHNMRGTSLDNFSQGAVWAEARLKEKNNG